MKYLSTFLFLSSPFIFMFAFISFVSWDPNPANWPEGVRFGGAALASVLAIPVFISWALPA
jgi:hypothetical protein